MLDMPADAKRISAASTGFYKRVLPVFWYGLMFVLLILSWKLKQLDHRIPSWIFLFPLFMAAVFHLLAKSLLSDLVDEVWDNGQELIVVNDEHVERVPLRDVINISYSGFTNPKRATLTLRHGGRWGASFGFIPVRSSIRILSLGTNQMIEELIRRVDRARSV